MTPERWAQIEELFHRVAESDPRSGTALLDDACRNDSDLREQVQALLADDQIAGERMQSAIRAELAALAFPLAGKTVSHYRILDGIGGGGMGLVYLAEDMKLGRPVAVKFLPEESANDPAALARFEREARSASALEHPNICPIYEFGEHEDQPFLVMQLLEGQTLREIIASKEPNKPPFEIVRLLDIATQIANGLNAAHKQGIIHRDIKPANIFVTTHGEVKLLDFGLAKLAHTDSETTKAEGSTTSPPLDPFLSRTDVTLGTAAYMSPEQVRGERLDARTDLFSFGLVLYEMATGKQAIKGETGPEMQQIILSGTPIPSRELNPEISTKLQAIINKCIEKERQARYQSASEISHDLERLRRALESRKSRWLVASAAVVLLAAVTFLRLHPGQQLLPHPALKLRQLTTNSVENNVSGGMISPDGKYLAFSDKKGLHLQRIETGETYGIPLPKELQGQNFDWQCAAWAPDTTRFLANSFPSKRDPGEIAEEDVSIWEVPLATRIPRKLRARAFAESFSRDGSMIAFGTNEGPHGPREIWLMDANGEHARKLFESGNDDTINSASWSADGRRLTYARDHGAEVTLFSRDLHGGPPVLLERPAQIKDKRIDYGITLPDGRSIFSVADEASMGMPNCNFWEVKNDLRTGRLIERPRQLTNWSGFCMDPTSVTSDGKRLAFVHMSGHPTINLADLESNGIQISNERHFTLTESMDVVADWTADSQSIIYYSRRNGEPGIYNQRIDSDTAKRLFVTQGDLAVCCVTPDDTWFIYLTQSNSDPTAGFNGELMRVPIEGGPSQTMFVAKNLEWWGCLKSPAKLCVIAERSDDRREAVITAFNPEKGRGAELARLKLDPNVTGWIMALSPEGKRIAVIRRPGAPLEILTLTGSILQKIEIPEWSNSGWMTWAPGGNALFVPVLDPEGSRLLRIGLNGGIRVVRKNLGGNFTAAVPSPDSRHIAIESTGDNRNIWLMENFQ